MRDEVSFGVMSTLLDSYTPKLFNKSNKQIIKTTD